MKDPQLLSLAFYEWTQNNHWSKYPKIERWRHTPPPVVILGHRAMGKPIAPKINAEIYAMFELSEEYSAIPDITVPQPSPDGCPAWLTPALRKDAREKWDSHETIEDNLRIEAIQIIRAAGSHATGFRITIPDALTMFEKFCKNYQEEAK